MMHECVFPSSLEREKYLEIDCNQTVVVVFPYSISYTHEAEGK